MSQNLSSHASKYEGALLFFSIMDEAKGKFYQFHDDTRAAFDELCAMVDALNVSQQYTSLGSSYTSVGVYIYNYCILGRER